MLHDALARSLVPSSLAKGARLGGERSKARCRKPVAMGVAEASIRGHGAAEHGGGRASRPTSSTPIAIEIARMRDAVGALDRVAVVASRQRRAGAIRRVVAARATRVRARCERAE